MAENKENTKNRLTGMLLSKNRRAQYIRLFAVLAACVAVVVAVVLHQNGVAMTHEEKVLTCPVEGVVAHTHNESCYDADGNLVCTLPERQLHTHTKECYDDKGTLICGQEEVTEEHVHGPGCFTTVTVQDSEETTATDAAATEATATETSAAGIATTVMPAQNFTGELKDQDDKVVLKVEVEAPEGAFPANTTMEIKALDTNEVKGAVDEAVAQKTKDKVAEVQAVDIKFFDGAGQEIEPAVDITVRFVSNVIAQNDNSYVVHVNKDGKGNVVDSLTNDQLAQRNQKAANDELYIDANEFSPYVLVGTKALTTDVLLADGNEYTVTVSYGEDAKIPEGATLKVAPFATDSEEYKNARNAVIVDKQAKGESVNEADLGLAAVDISILDTSGKEIEPAATVTVNMKIKELPEVEDIKKVEDTLEIQHHVETDKGVVVETVAGQSTDATFKMATDAEVAKNGTAVDPNANKETVTPKETEVTFNTEVFSTFTITWKSNHGGDRLANVYYVDENGNNLNIANNPGAQPSGSNFNGSSDSPAFLIYDIDGYEYKETRLNDRTTGTKIKPMMTKSDNGRWSYVKDGNNYETAQLSNGNNIYVIYKQKTHTTGGTPSTSANEGDWPTGDGMPKFTKSSTANGDDTNTISLGIKAAEKEFDEITKANIIVIFDLSNSMREDMAGGSHNWDGSIGGWKDYWGNTYDKINEGSRLSIAGSAVKTLASTLMPENGGGNVKMSLITFSNDASPVTFAGNAVWTDSSTTFNNAVNGLRANTNGGTNWEAALTLADRTANAAGESDAATFIVFVSDGDPTFRQTRGDYSDEDIDLRTDSNYSYYRNYNIYGTGTLGDGSYSERNYPPALAVLNEIKGHNKTFYSVGVSDDPKKMTVLVNDAEYGTYYPGANEDELAGAFENIAQAVKSTLGFSNIQITDGITELTHVNMKVMSTVDPNSFTYYRWGGENNKYGADYNNKQPWTTREADGCAAASYSDGAVHWNMGEGFQLEDGVNYVVEFRAWPSQAAYDLVADLNNGIKVYDAGHPNSITDGERAQIVEKAAPSQGNQGSYELKTNTDQVYAQYKKSSRTGDTVSSTGGLQTAQYTEGTIQNLYLESMKLTVKKVFQDELTYDPRVGHGEDQPKEVELVLKRRNAYTKQANSDIYAKNSGAFENYMAKQSNGSLSEKIKLDATNNWTFETYIAPGFMLGDANGTVLIDNNKYTVLEPGYDFTIEEPDVERHYELIAEIVNPMVVDGQGRYIGDTNNDQSLTAINRVKSGIDVWKNVYANDGTTLIYPSTEFTIRGQLLDKNGQPFTWDQAAYDSETDADKKAEMLNATGAYHIYDKAGNKRVEKGHFASTGEIELKLKAGEHARFINVPEGCTFHFTEVLPVNDYELKSLETRVQSRAANGGEFSDDENNPITVDQPSATATLASTGVVGNKQYEVKFNNKKQTPLTQAIRFRKVGLVNQQDTGLPGAEFNLTVGGDTYSLKSENDGYMSYGEDNNNKKFVIDIPVTSDNHAYTLTETKAPDGYWKIDGSINIQVTNGTVTASRQIANGQSVYYDGKEETINGVTAYTIFIPNQNGNELPATGGIGTTAYYIAGATVAAVGLYGLYRRRNAMHTS